MNTALHDKIAALMLETAKAHRRALAPTDGDDPEWPMWYAQHLHEPLSEALGVELSRSYLVHCLITADLEHAARASEVGWPEFYAEHFIEHFAPTTTPRQDRLALYHFFGCPFCSMVTSVIDRLGVEVELRDIFGNAEHRNELIEARGRATVPVLRITAADGEDVWMPESRDIVRFLEKAYG